jgi:hypothetical protein
MQAGMKRVLQVPRSQRVKSGDDAEATPIKIEIYGAWGSGKTFCIKSLLDLGFKVLVVTTDIGGSGLSSVKIPLRREGKQELLKDLLREVILDNDEEVQAFVFDPTTFFPEIYEWNPDFVVWDGWGSWQQIQLMERVGAMPTERKGKELAEAVEEGLKLEQDQWGMIKIGTTRTTHKFCALSNKTTGKVWHKILTAQEGYKSVKQGDNTSELKETKQPLVQGAGGILSGGAFDLIIRTAKDTVGGKDTFKYQIRQQNTVSKVRGFELPAEMDADFGKLWEMISTQAGIITNKQETI